MKQKSSNNTIRKSSFDEDPYDFSTKDPAKSRALESSLWEMTALENHYFPQVTKTGPNAPHGPRATVVKSESPKSIFRVAAPAQYSLCSARGLFPLERRVGRSLEVGGVETRHYRGSRFISLGANEPNAAGFGELIQWKEEEEEDFGRS